MPKKKTYEYTVTGPGPFPIDMLRYDMAMPKSESDASAITKSFYRRGGEGLIEVKVISDHKGPTVGRWESFGWRVELVQERMVTV